ncbi:hypothetical protein JCM8097_003918 [Rhodosporidiobolus ruineniae]
MLSLSVLGLIVATAARGIAAQNCPAGSQIYTYDSTTTNIVGDDFDVSPTTTVTACCSSILTSDNLSCSLLQSISTGDNVGQTWDLECYTSGPGVATWSIADGVTVGNAWAGMHTAGDNPRQFSWGSLAMMRRPQARKFALVVDGTNPDGSLYSGIGDYSCVADSPTGICSLSALQISTTYTTSTLNDPADWYVVNGVGGYQLGYPAQTGQIAMHAFVYDMQCSAPSAPEPDVSVTTFGSTATATSTNYIETQYTPSATITEQPTSTVTATPGVSTVTETKTEEVDLGPDYYPIYVNAGTSTAATETVQATTTLTDTPSTATTTTTVTPATSTVYETSWATSTPPTKTVTSVQTVQTGNAGCTNFRLVFPADCCPNEYVKLKSLHRRAVNLEKRATITVDGGVTTSTQVVDATQALPSGQATVTSSVTETKTAEAPLTTTTITTTETLPQPQIGYTVSEYDEVVTPLETVYHTVRETAATPTQVVSVTAAQPVSTVRVTSTTTLQQPVTTTTSTAYAQATTCAVKTVYTQASCPSSNLVKTLVQDAQVATLNLYKALGGKSVIVECGSAGTFSY